MKTLREFKEEVEAGKKHKSNTDTCPDCKSPVNKYHSRQSGEMTYVCTNHKCGFEYP